MPDANGLHSAKVEYRRVSLAILPVKGLDHVDAQIFKVFRSVLTREGAGVHLKRAFGYHQVPMFDPFLMLDDFHTSDPAEYLAGFPWHPHRGIETITYILEGLVEHGDSMGNKGVIGAGDVQWMTAGREGVRFLLLCGRPLEESVAWQGPIVMNTREELRIAFEEFHKGIFVK